MSKKANYIPADQREGWNPKKIRKIPKWKANRWTGTHFDTTRAGGRSRDGRK
jgi:hypothetical protein